MALSADQREEMLMNILNAFTRGGGMSSTSAMSLQNAGSGGLIGGMGRATNVINAITGASGKGAGASLEGMNNAIGGTTGKLSKLSSMFVELWNSMSRFSASIVEGNRKISMYGAEAARGQAELDIGRKSREIRLGLYTSESSAEASRARNRREEATFQIEVGKKEIENRIAAAFDNATAAAAETVLDAINEQAFGKEAAEQLRKEREENLKLTSMTLNEIASNIADGVYTQPKLPPMPAPVRR